MSSDGLWGLGGVIRKRTGEPTTAGSSGPYPVFSTAMSDTGLYPHGCPGSDLVADDHDTDPHRLLGSLPGPLDSKGNTQLKAVPRIRKNFPVNGK